MIRPAGFCALIALGSIILLGYINVFIEAAEIGYIADALGRPQSGVVPRFPWELNLAIVLLAFGSALLLRQVAAATPAKSISSAFAATAGLTAVAHAAGLAITSSEWASDNIVIRSFTLGATSQYVLLMVGIFLVLAWTSYNSDDRSHAEV